MSHRHPDRSAHAPRVLAMLPAKYPQEQFALPLPGRRRYRFVVEYRRPHEDARGFLVPTADSPPWQVAAVYPSRRFAIVHRRLIARNHGHAGYEVRIRREGFPW